MTRLGWLILTLVVVLGGVWAVRAEPAADVPASRPATTQASTQPVGERLAGVKDVVVLKELMTTYEAVPFAHRKHAEMAQMGDGCKTCHHREPASAATRKNATTRSSESAPNEDGTPHETTEAERVAWQGEAAKTPACKTCHPVGDGVGIEVPSLKGAYHRQCLNCHRDWMEGNACAVCHAVRAGATTAAATGPSRDDIVGRMHQPLVPPKETVLTARYLPADGRKVLFRHDGHVKSFGVTCASCHQRGSCGVCHSAGAGAKPATTPLPLTTNSTPDVAGVMRGGATWREAHRPCGTCHEGDRCKTCHYEEGKTAPPAFAHESTGQKLDKDHASLACVACHAEARTARIAASATTCGKPECHKRAVNWPKDRPGERVVATMGAATTQADVTTAPTPAPAATRPVIIKIRRGGQ